MANSAKLQRIPNQNGNPARTRLKDGQAPSSTTVTTSETINSEKYPEGDQVSKRTLRDSFNIFEPRALPGAIPQMIMCPTFGFGVFFAGLYGTTLGYTHAGLLLHHQRGKHDYIRMISKHFHGHRICNQNNDRSRRVRHPLLPYATCRTVRGTCLPGVGIFYGLATGISLPLNQSVAVKNTPPERWGAANALFLLANDIGIGFASVIWGVINDSFGFQTSIVCVIVCLIASYASAWIVYPARDKRWRH